MESFRSLVAAASATHDPTEQLRLYRAALALDDGEIDLRLAAAESYARLALDAGEPIASLLPLVRAHPTRERLVALMMTGLHRADRRADALTLFAEAAAALGDHGVSPALAELRDRVDAGDPALNRPPGPIYAVRVRDEWLPWNTSGHPVLEFCNTLAGWGGEERHHHEWLSGYRTLAVWTGHLGLADDWIITRLIREATRDPQAAAEALTEARELRARLYTALTDPADAAAFKAIAQTAEAAAHASTFVRGRDGLGRWRVGANAGLRLPALAVAWSATDLLADPRRLTIRVCPGRHCGWLFLDEQGRRRFCSLGMCGPQACR